MKKAIVGLFALFVIGCSTDKTLTEAEQLKKDVATIDKYIVDNNILNVKEDPSGLRYVVTAEPNPGGVKPLATSTITVRYVGKLMSSGVVFDQRTTSAATFPLSGLIEGWIIGFQLLTKGSKATLYIPSKLGYGTTGSQTGVVPANSILIFDVELLDVK